MVLKRKTAEACNRRFPLDLLHADSVDKISHRMQHQETFIQVFNKKNQQKYIYNEAFYAMHTFFISAGTDK